MINDKYLRKMFRETKANALISWAPQTRLWLTEISSSDGLLVATARKNFLFVDGRYFEYAQASAKNAEVILLNQAAISNFFSKKAFKIVAIEEDYLLLKEFENLKKQLPNTKFVPIKAQALRTLKTPQEIAKLQKAVDISLKALDELVNKHLFVGMSESQIANKLNYLMVTYGAQKPGFDTIIASGPNSAKPHWSPSERKLQAGELLKIDFGAQYQGYTADITRTFIFKENENTNSEALKILAIVKEAARLGREAVAPGISSQTIDQICRDHISAAGYGKYFIHATGHGLGIDVHELPNLNSQSQDILEIGNVITVEPGIYIPGLGGARIEDDLVVTKEGSYVLSRHQELNLK